MAAVILSVCARTVSNPMMVRSESVDDFSVDRTVVLGWTLAELAVLNGHRKRAAQGRNVTPASDPSAGQRAKVGKWPVLRATQEPPTAMFVGGSLHR